MVRRTSTAGNRVFLYHIPRRSAISSFLSSFYPTSGWFLLGYTRLRQLTAGLTDLFYQLTKRQQCVDLALGEVMAG